MSILSATVRGGRQHPGFGSPVMGMRLEGECEPEVKIRKMHLRRPGSRQSSHSSVAGFRDLTRGPAETQPVSGAGQPGSRESGDKTPAQQPLRATTEGHRAQPRHSELVLGFPSSDCMVSVHRHQELILRNGGHS